ncbi:MAG: type IV toxin-antitoxin system AbiEi family antitoxin domain-containing protein [Vulcanibacillus sp.]
MEQKIQKINLLLSKGEPLFASYLKEMGYSSQLLSRYVKSKWLEMPYKGVYIKPKSAISIGGLLNALVYQKRISVHIAGLDALKLFGYFEQIAFVNKTITIYSDKRIYIPKWVKKFEKENNIKIKLVCTNLFSDGMFISKSEYDRFILPVSIPERAVFEALNEVKSSAEYYEFLKVFEIIADLKSDYLDALLLKCNSVKVKRLFLYVSELTGKPYFKKLNLNKYDLGNGVRTLFLDEKQMKYNAKFKIMVPKERQS